MRSFPRSAPIAGVLAVMVVAAAMTRGPDRDRADQPPPTRPVSATALAGAGSASRDLLVDDADVWTPPSPLPDGEPGDLIQAQRVPRVPRAPRSVGAVYRVLYRSQSVAGEPIAVSGAVFVPRGRPPDGGWPIISWARGTSGTADSCAPSRSIGADTVPFALVQAGFVVAATDYEGLGTPGPHPYLVGASEGRAVLDIVSAVDDLPGVPTTRSVAVWGHSQGGHAALFARELAATWLPDHRLVGTVAMAPPSFIPQMVDTWALTLPAKALGIMGLAGLAAAYPQARLETIIAPAHLDEVRAAIEHGCTDDVNRAFAAIPPGELFLGDPAATSPWAELLHAQEPAQRPGTGPVLLVHGELDATLPPTMSLAVESQLCRRGEQVQRWLVPDQGHGDIIMGQWDEMLRWTRDRFAGRTPPPSTCASPG